MQADGQRLPFRDAAFDAVMLIQVFGGCATGGSSPPRRGACCARTGALVIGRIGRARGRRRRAHEAAARVISRSRGRRADHVNARDDVGTRLGRSRDERRVVAADGRRSARRAQFIDRHRTGARFSALPEPVKDEALARLAAWARATFGSLDAASPEPHAFELQIFKFRKERSLTCRT